MGSQTIGRNPFSFAAGLRLNGSIETVRSIRGDRGQHTYPQKLPQPVIQALKDPRYQKERQRSHLSRHFAPLALLCGGVDQTTRTLSVLHQEVG
jgi:hypothetical protein